MSYQDSLMDDVRKKIEESLPAIQVDVFREFVDKANEEKEELGMLKSSYECVSKELESCRKELKDLNTLNLSKHAVERDRTQLTHDRDVFEITKSLKDAKITSETEKRELVSDMFNQVFRNVEMRRNTLGMVPMREKCSDGSEYSSSVQADLTESETKL